MAPTVEVCSTVTINHDGTLVKLSRVVVGGFEAVLEPGRGGFNDGERRIGIDTGFVDGVVDYCIHFGQGLYEGGVVVELEEILTWHGVA